MKVKSASIPKAISPLPFKRNRLAALEASAQAPQG